MSFDIQSHMINLKGKEYLETKWRIVWFHDEHPAPSGGISTELINIQPPIVKATVYIDGQPISTGHASAVAKANAVWAGREIEKAETAAIGRALAHAGYGMDVEDEDDFLADSPTPVKQTQKQTPAPAQTNASASNSSAPAVQDVSTTPPPENAQIAPAPLFVGNKVISESVDETDAWFAALEPTWNTIKSKLLKDVFPQFWSIVAAAKIYDNGNHMRNSVNKLQADGLIVPASQTLRQAVMVVVSHKQVKYGDNTTKLSTDDLKGSMERAKEHIA